MKATKRTNLLCIFSLGTSWDWRWKMFNNSLFLGFRENSACWRSGSLGFWKKNNIPNQGNILQCLHREYPLPTTNSPLPWSFPPVLLTRWSCRVRGRRCLRWYVRKRRWEKPTRANWEQYPRTPQPNTTKIQPTHSNWHSNSIQQPTTLAVAPAWHNPCVVFGTVHGLARPLGDAACPITRQDMFMIFLAWSHGQRKIKIHANLIQFDKFCT